MKKWIITGSRSGAGKSTLVDALATVLPISIQLKLGHRPKKAKGPANYFTELSDALELVKEIEGKFSHCLMEGSRFISAVDADVIIFIDAMDGDHRPDADKLMNKADIVIRPDSVKGVPKGLAGLGLKDTTRRKIIDVLEKQRKYLDGHRMSLGTKLWISREGNYVFGEGLARLLRGIKTHGSLSASAKDMGLSYRHAWGEIKKAERRLGMELVKSKPGGVDGGGSHLTEKAERLLEGYEKIRQRILKDGDKYFQELVKEIEGIS